ncbi:MAG: hypothetical protein AMXMBFR13_01950 [Phycisphaerae bacterium]
MSRHKYDLTYEGFIAGLKEELGEEAARDFTRLYEWIEIYSDRKKGQWGAEPSYIPYFLNRPGRPRRIVQVWWPTHDDHRLRVMIDFGDLRKDKPFNIATLCEALRCKFNEIPGVDLPPAEDRPTFDIKILRNAENFELFKETVLWARNQLNGT